MSKATAPEVALGVFACTIPGFMRPWAEYRCVLFDCDGVLLDSNRVKTQAFEQVLAGAEPGKLRRFLAEHRATGGVSRYEKFRRWYGEIEGTTTGLDARVAAAAARFSEFARKGLRGVSPLPGVRERLAMLHGRGVPMFVVSGGDQDEVREALEHHRLASFFESILGSPVTKAEHFARLASQRRLTPPTLYVGDARLDMEMAQAHGLDFLFVAGATDWPDGRFVCRARGYSVVENFR